MLVVLKVRNTQFCYISIHNPLYKCVLAVIKVYNNYYYGSNYYFLSSIFSNHKLKTFCGSKTIFFINVKKNKFNIYGMCIHIFYFLHLN